MTLCVYYTQGPGGQQKGKLSNHSFFFFKKKKEFKNNDDGPLLGLPFFQVDCHVSVAAVKMGQVACLFLNPILFHRYQQVESQWRQDFSEKEKERNS